MSNISSSNGHKELSPRLRFPEFEEEWKTQKLRDFTERITRKNSDNQTQLPLTISSKDGLVDQVTYFNKQVSSKDMSGYYLLKNGEFAYNKSYSVGYDFGSIKRLDRYPMGALSTLYICFALTRHNSDFMKVYFDSLKWYKEIYMIAAEGARNHGLLNVPTDDFFDTLHILPQNPNEQDKIAKFLILVEKRIEKQQALVDNLKSYKRGYFNRLIASFSTVEYYIKDIVEEYTQKTLTNGEYPILSSTMNGIKMQSAYFNKQAASENTIGYKIVPYGYFTYRSMSDTGEFHFNYQDIIEKGIVSPAYPVFMVKATNNSRYVEYILNELPIIKTQLMVVKEGGTRYALSFSKLQALHIPLPAKELQDKVENQILLFEKQEKAQELILEKMIALKTALLQQLFI